MPMPSCHGMKASYEPTRANMLMPSSSLMPGGILPPKTPNGVGTFTWMAAWPFFAVIWLRWRRRVQSWRSYLARLS